MRDPYLLLGVPEDADDAAVHTAYLKAVATCTPDADPKGFQALRAAFESIETQRKRLSHEYMDSRPPEALDMLDILAPLDPKEARRPTLAQLQALLRRES